MRNLWQDNLSIRAGTAPEALLAKTTHYTTEFKRVRLESLVNNKKHVLTHTHYLELLELDHAPKRRDERILQVRPVNKGSAMIFCKKR